ncbi:MAG TPA: DUF6345 domain-containing protein [Gaiellaceae bacterium]|nr:DUF6345 domain-containing protein [Gaiellaceae bacterium]
MRKVAFAAAAAALVACVVASPSFASSKSVKANGTFPRAPIYSVGPSPISAGIGEQLMEILGLQGNPFSDLDGSLRYLDPDLFLALPTIPLPDPPPDESGNPTTGEAVDLGAVAQMTAPNSDLALETAFNAFSEVGLADDLKAVSAKANVGHAMFQSFGTPEGPISVPVDTEVHYSFSLGGHALIGPGAEGVMSFSGDGEVSQMLLNFPSVSKGDPIRLLTTQVATQLARKIVTGPCGNGATAKIQFRTPKLVYFAPSSSVDTLYPWYQFDGTVPGKLPFQVRSLLVPANQDGKLQATVSLSSGNGLVNASAKPRGGTPPYTYQWTSCSTTLDPDQASQQSVSYKPASRSPGNVEVVSVEVTDANGLVAQATGRVAVATPGAAIRIVQGVQGVQGVQSIPRVDAGIEWIGTCGGLPGSAVSAGGFVANMTAFGPIPIQFNWGDNNAWERDFKDPTKGGQDSSYVDDVDLTFYTGHAGDWGWWFCNPNHDDQNMTFSDAFLGDRDLEWLGIAACGPLQAVDGAGRTWYQRWGPAFQGLHLLMGYATTSFDNTVEGPNFARYILGIPGLGWLGFGPITVRQAWAQMAMDAQPSSVTWAEMGVFGSGGMSDWNDYFWGRGPTGPDIPQSSITGYWRLSGPS